MKLLGKRTRPTYVENQFAPRPRPSEAEILDEVWRALRNAYFELPEGSPWRAKLEGWEHAISSRPSQDC